jgi:hypothetical protein
MATSRSRRSNNNNDDLTPPPAQVEPELPEQELPPLTLEIAPWIGPVSFVGTVGVSIWFIPAAWAIIVGFAVFVIVEATLATYKSNWLRPTTILEPTAKLGHRWFDRAGAGVAAAFDIAWWLDILWEFLRRILPLDTLWTATVQLITALFQVATIPFSFIIGIARGLVSSRTPVASLLLCLLAIAVVAVSIGYNEPPWRVVCFIMMRMKVTQSC